MSTPQNKRAFLPIVIVVALASGNLFGCSVILGKADDDSSAGRQAEPVRIRYVETLKNEASLSTERYEISGVISLPSSSIQQPSSVAADATRVYVTTHAPSSRLAIFDRSARSLKIISSPTPTVLGRQFSELTSVSVAPSGEIFIADAQLGKVFGLDREGNLLRTIGKTGNLIYPAAIAVDSMSRHIYIADKHANAIRMFTTDGEWVRDITDAGENKRLAAPAGLAFATDGSCYVLDVRSRRVYVYGRTGELLRTFGLLTDVAHEMIQPKGIAVDSDGHVYIGDTYSNSILIFGKNGEFLQRWGRVGDKFNEFWQPGALFIDSRDFIYVADQMNGRIQVFHYEK